MNKVFQVCIFVEFVIMLLGLMGLPLLLYPGTGISFSICVIVMIYVGKMDFMNEDTDKPVEGYRRCMNEGTGKPVEGYRSCGV